MFTFIHTHTACIYLNVNNSNLLGGGFFFLFAYLYFKCSFYNECITLGLKITESIFETLI